MTRAPLRENAKRSVMIAGHRTSVSLEAEFWSALQDIALGRGQSVQALIGAIDSERGERNLSSAIRVFVLRVFRDGSAPSERPFPDRAGIGEGVQEAGGRMGEA
ncbi:ribbon-helix-helix domain-containing protein [Methylorubrum populi]|jgi:predicted DNA-binding ribbon-helix-helix protein|uniref:Ribbon-helix-helix domain-containing protein n=2 Tax=Methylorubrum rhodesianum TaxID=29427 RepID=A0ABU9ZE10_9HYPH|nr:ribbon-helix-helix domain-containing protein [Methylorubrum rhodesianum]MBK3406207.1 ribbon-helix-helix domain-containing protein [Methylorubrum rhodesianum]MBY0143299.1 ribbon-helix-helix domain-containing protein [Methylorubrum populi]